MVVDDVRVANAQLHNSAHVFQQFGEWVQYDDFLSVFAHSDTCLVVPTPLRGLLLLLHTPAPITRACDKNNRFVVISNESGPRQTSRIFEASFYLCIQRWGFLLTRQGSHLQLALIKRDVAFGLYVTPATFPSFLHSTCEKRQLDNHLVHYGHKAPT